MQPPWLELLHVLTASVWTGGLIALPLVLLRQEAGGDGMQLFAVRIGTAIRTLYLFLLCPTAILAVTTGLALASRTTQDAPSAKLWLVTGLALMHLLAARRILNSLSASRAPAAPLLRASAIVTAGFGAAVLLLGSTGRDEASLSACPASILHGPPGESLTLLSCSSTPRP